jgi:glycosyltransferase involved in cell wall biosynthesis
MTAVHQVLAKLADGDAIGHEVLGIQRVLQRAGYESEIFVEVADAAVARLTYDYRALRDFSHRDNVLIHHFSVGSDASRLAYSLPDRMMLVYHNITPAEYFVSFHLPLARFCYLGRRELRAYARRCVLALGDSEFNRLELEATGFPRTAVLPVVPGFSHLDVAPSQAITTMFDDDWTNILFVGRMVPNKRIEDVIRFFHAYQTNFNRRSRLFLVGSKSGLDLYVDALVQLIHDLGQQQHVLLTGHVSNAELTTYYNVADLFLCASEHEGFCVPLVEAFYKQVPVLAYAAAAVPSTMDGAGVLYESRDPMYVATIMDDLLSDVRAQEEVVRGQSMALERLMSKDFEHTLLKFVDASRAAATGR